MLIWAGPAENLHRAVHGFPRATSSGLLRLNCCEAFSRPSLPTLGRPGCAPNDRRDPDSSPGHSCQLPRIGAAFDLRFGKLREGLIPSREFQSRVFWDGLWVLVGILETSSRHDVAYVHLEFVGYTLDCKLDRQVLGIQTQNATCFGRDSGIQVDRQQSRRKTNGKRAMWIQLSEESAV